MSSYEDEYKWEETDSCIDTFLSEIFRQTVVDQRNLNLHTSQKWQGCLDFCSAIDRKKRNTLSTTTVQLKYSGGGGCCVLVMQQSRDQILCTLCWYKKFKIHTGTWLCSCLPFYAFGELKNYSSTHFLLLVGSGGSKAARIASSKTFLSPFCKT
jgi:hypothetical protein